MKALFTFIVGFSLALTSLAGPTNQTTNASGEQLLTYEYRIKSETFVRSLKQLKSPKPDESNQALLVRYFKENKVVVEKPGAVFLDEKGNRLLIRGTKTQQEKIKALFTQIHLNQ